LKDKKVSDRLTMLEQLDVSKGILAIARKANNEADFAETILVLWGELELNIDVLIAREFGVAYDDVEASFLTRRGIEEKINFLKQMNVLDKDDVEKIKKFQTKRNELFHSKRGKEQLYFTLSNNDKKEMMSDAWAAYVLVLSLIADNIEVDAPEALVEGQAADEPDPDEQ